MKPSFFATFLLLILFSIPAFSQRILTGVIKIAEQPVSNLTVYTSFATTKTDDLGRYSLTLDGCSNCRVGDKIVIYTFNIAYGSSEQTYTISNDYTFNFSISRNSPNIIVTGIVRSSGSDGTPLENIAVKIVDLDYNIDAVKTNEFGEFKISIPKNILPSNFSAARLQVIDPRKKYRPIRIDPELYSVNSFVTILMEPSVAYNIQVSGITRTRICVSEGDAVSISASGQIHVGSSVGNSDPDGRTSGVFGMSLESYNIVSNFNHAALMYRFEGDSEWKVAGKQAKFIASKSGCLEFEVNDNDQGNNSGHYDVEISIRSI